MATVEERLEALEQLAEKFGGEVLAKVESIVQVLAGVDEHRNRSVKEALGEIKKIVDPDADFSIAVESADEHADEKPESPPKAGKGSGVDAWREYAEALGVEIDDDATRDDIIEAVESADEPADDEKPEGE